MQDHSITSKWPLQYQLLPSLSEDEYQTLKADIAERGVQVPVEYDDEGNCLDGHHRLRACAELGILNYPTVVRAGMSEAQKLEHVLALNLKRRHLTREQRAELVATLRQQGMSTRRIAETVKVSQSTISRDVTGEPFGSPAPDRIIGADGKSYPSQRQTGVDLVWDENPRVYQPVAATVFSFKSVEYDTPRHILDTARALLRTIDLDPASNAEAQENVRATTYYTKEQDGLLQPWAGRVWLNPPYGKTGGKSNQELWSQRLIEEHRAGRVTEALLLVKAALGYRWFEELFRDWPVCFVRERLSFILDSGDDEGQSKQGTAIFYFGPRARAFAEAFRPLGRVIPPEARLDLTLFG